MERLSNQNPRRPKNPGGHKTGYVLPSQKPLILVVSGPSGAGKDTVLNYLRERITGADFIVTVTTRPKREYEVEGVNYHFVSLDLFQTMLDRGELLEHACVYGNWYGVPEREVFKSVQSGRDAIIKVDIQGAAAIKKSVPEACFVFIAPADITELDIRLKKRNTESGRELEARLKTAGSEFDRLPMFDYLVVNASGKIDRAVDDMMAIVRAEKLRTTRVQVKNYENTPSSREKR